MLEFMIILAVILIVGLSAMFGIDYLIDRWKQRSR